VKSAKHRLLRGASNANLTQDELSTHLVDVEALLNSRPLLVDSSDPSDGEVLTPGHLLIGQPLLALPSGSDPDGSSSKQGRGYLRLWQQLSALKRHFWRKWSKDYLLSLQQRTQWAKGEDNLEEGAVVLVHDDNTPPQQWITGRVTRTIRGEDGKVRVAEIKTPAGAIKRPIHKLARLPMC
jgi:aminopeptidase